MKKCLILRIFTRVDQKFPEDSDIPEKQKFPELSRTSGFSEEVDTLPSELYIVHQGREVGFLRPSMEFAV